MYGRVRAACKKDQRNHRCGRGLSVRSGDIDNVIEVSRDKAQEHRTLHHGKSFFTGISELRISGKDRRGMHDHVRRKLFDIVRAVPAVNGDADFL